MAKSPNRPAGLGPGHVEGAGDHAASSLACLGERQNLVESEPAGSRASSIFWVDSAGIEPDLEVRVRDLRVHISHRS